MSQSAPDCISAHIHYKTFPVGGGGMPPDPARKLVAFGHSGTLNYKVIRLLIWDYFVLSLAAMCYSTAGTTYSFFDPVLGPHLQSVRFYNNNNNNNNNNTQ